MRIRALHFVFALLFSTAVPADVALENYGGLTIETIPKHTLLINTFGANTLVVDADSQKVLGMLSLGIGANALEVDRNQGVIHVAETYLSRHTRGERTDVISTYDISTLSAKSEIVIPPKHASGSPQRHYSGMLRDGAGVELMLVTNITPAVTISVANLSTGKFVGELGAAGCGLVYPDSGLRFMQLCGDGTAQLVTLNPDGSEASRIRSRTFFDLDDPLMEKGVKTEDGWLFNTFEGKVFQLHADDDNIKVISLFTLGDESGSWRVGGMQPLAYHAGTNLLLSLMHQGGDGTHKDPGTEVWYTDVASGNLLHRLALQNPTSSIQVSQDDQPLLYGASIIAGEVNIHDLKTGRVSGTLSDIAVPTILQNL